MRPSHPVCAALILAAALAWAFVAGGCQPEAKAVRLAVNPWLASELNAQVAAILLREHLHLPAEIVAVDEYEQWPALVRGDLDACLEVWPSGHQHDIDTYLGRAQGVESLGLLGVVGKIGWYAPRCLMREHPALATWQGLRDPALAAVFATPSSHGKGQFLAGDPSWVQYDRQIIANPGLDLSVVQAGSEQAIMAAVDQAFAQGRPILFYFWFPHPLHVKYSLAEVKLPPYNDECYAKAAQGGVACGYPPDILLKIAWPGLREKSPAAYEFLRNFNLTDQDQLAMMSQVSLGRSPAQAARTWLDANQRRWKEWMPVD
ncbi:MAG: glycine betaine ABC transporter substrate-binding protein [Pseudomonadota bacterium]